MITMGLRIKKTCQIIIALEYSGKNSEEEDKYEAVFVHPPKESAGDIRTLDTIK